MPLVVNGYTIGVRLNCSYALWQLRNAAIEVPLWIDTIAIDQSNNTEKSVQVGRMGELYAKARSVAACIGMGHFLQTLTHETPNRDYDKMIWEELGRLPYWHRAWIRQEVILARNVHIYCGHVVQPWDELSLLYQRLLDKPALTSSDNVVATLIDQRALHQERSSERNSLNSSRLIRQFQSLRCADPKDKIYALISLIPEGDPLFGAIVPNYSQPRLDFFLELQSLLTRPEFFKLDDDPVKLLSELLKWLDISQTSEDARLFWNRQQRTDVHSTNPGKSSTRFMVSRVSRCRPHRDLAMLVTATTRPERTLPFFERITVLTPTFTIPSELITNNKSRVLSRQIPGSSLMPGAHHGGGILRGKLLLRNGCLGWTRRARFDKICSPHLRFQIFLVNEDVQQNDITAQVQWSYEVSSYKASSGYQAEDVKTPKYASMVIIRRHEAAPTKERREMLRATYALHSWAFSAIDASDHHQFSDAEEFTSCLDHPDKFISKWSPTLRHLTEDGTRRPADCSAAVAFSSPQFANMLIVNRDISSAFEVSAQQVGQADFDHASCANLDLLVDSADQQWNEDDKDVAAGIVYIQAEWDPI